MTQTPNIPLTQFLIHEADQLVYLAQATLKSPNSYLSHQHRVKPETDDLTFEKNNHEEADTSISVVSN